MGWIQYINRFDQARKEGFYGHLIPPSLFRMLKINPINFHNDKDVKLVRFFCPEGENTCFVEIKIEGIEEPVYYIEISDSIDATMMEWDFLIINDPKSRQFRTHVTEEGKDTLFGWASRNIKEEEKAMKAGYFPGQSRKGLHLTRDVIHALDIFCRILDIKSIRLEALFYHNAIAYERYGFSYFTGYDRIKRINELFQPGGILYNKLDNSTPFRRPEFAQSIRGRSWAIHDGIIKDVADDILQGKWVSPIMYRMVEKPESMLTFPDPKY